MGGCGYICLCRLLWCHRQDRKKSFLGGIAQMAQLWIGPDTKQDLRTKSLLAAFRNCFHGSAQLTTDWRVSGKMRHLCLRLNVIVIAVKWLGQAEGNGTLRAPEGPLATRLKLAKIGTRMLFSEKNFSLRISFCPKWHEAMHNVSL